jgi:predicted metal-dependent HD superfamily phosphohydrolase
VLTRWTELLARVAPPAGGPAVRAAGTDLLARYAEPQRRYHDQRHLAEVLSAVDRLSAEAAALDVPVDAVRLGAWFHDAVYDPRAEAGANEAASAALAGSVLGRLGVEADLVDQVVALVMMTAEHEPQGPAATVLSDADLAILGAPAARYAGYAADVRREYAHVSDPAFRSGRAAILRGFLERPRIFGTATGYAAWEQPARANLAAELRELSA